MSSAAWGQVARGQTNAAVGSRPATPVQSTVATTGGSPTRYYCPNCKRYHTVVTSTPQVIESKTAVTSESATSKSAASASETTNTDSSTHTSYRVPVQAPSIGTVARSVVTKTGNAAANVLDMLNRQRSRQGLRTLRYDPVLQAVAERRARQMASTGRKGHPPGSFAPGRYEGVGWSSSFSPTGVRACYTSSPNMTAAGAAMARGRDGVYFAVVYR